MSQMKGLDKIPEKQLNEVEIGNLSEKAVRIMIMKMIQDGEDVRNIYRNVYQRSSKTKEQTNRNEQYTRRNQSRITEAKKWISDLEQNGGSICCKTEYRKKKVKRNEDGLRDLWDDIKCTFTI